MKALRAYKNLSKDRIPAGSIPYIVFSISFFLTLLASFIYYMTILSKDKLRFESSVIRNHYSIEDRIQTYLDLLSAVNGLFSAHPETTKEDFKAFIDQLEFQKKYPGIQGIGFAIRIPASEKEILYAKMRNEGVTNFSIHPDTARSEYTAIIYLEPQGNRNNAAIGYDMFTDEKRREAMSQARDTGQTTTSKRVQLIQEIDTHKQPGFLMYVPVYDGGLPPKTIEERREKLIGYVYSPFRTYDLFNAITQKSKSAEIDFKVYEGQTINSSNLLYESVQSKSSYHPFFSKIVRINIVGIPWTFVYSSTPKFDISSERTLIPYIFYSGLMISIILFFLSRSQYLAEQSTEKALIELSKSQSALNDSNKQISSILKSITDGFVSLDKKWNFVYVNKAAADIFGKDIKSLIGNNIWQELPELTDSRFGKLFKKASLENLKQEIEDYYAPLASWYTVRAFPSKSGLSIYFHNITERKVLEQRKDEFISIANHELKTPLTTIKGYVQILERVMKKRDFEKMELYLGRTNLYINKLHDLISDLLDVSKIQAGKLTFNIAIFDYSELVREVVESIQPTSPSHRIMIHMDSSFKVRGDRNRIEQVLNNLLSNAIKYSPYQSEIDVTVVKKDHKIVTSVRDYGVGISPKDQKRLFERFYRAQKIAKDFSGLGIGLFISSEIVKRHSGTIWVESIEDKGSTFSFTLPSIS